MLLSIALMPLVAPRFWAARFRQVAIAWAFIFAAPFTVAYGPVAIWKVAETLLADYLPFIILLWGLYTVSGGIYLKATLVATPGLNAAFLAAGTVLASLMGTTGAAMLIVRPLLRANAWRRRRGHVFVFLIFLVANIGGLLTPLGDPPLFLGFIHGVPFSWTLRLLPQFLFVVALVLGAFVAIDWWLFRKEIERRPDHHVPIRKIRFKVEGGGNFLLLAVILGAVLLSGVWNSGSATLMGIHVSLSGLVRDALILLAGWISIRTTPKQARTDNEFSWVPIEEVAFLFLGIFVTITPVIMILRAGADGGFAPLVVRVSEAWHYFWLTGALSSVLDNAPTYLAFVQHGARRARHPARPGRRRPVRDDQPVARRHLCSLPRGDLARCGVHGREHLHRQRAESDGLVDSKGTRREDARILRLHALDRGDPASRLSCPDLGVPLIQRVVLLHHPWTLFDRVACPRPAV